MNARTNAGNDGKRFEGLVKDVAADYFRKKILRLEKVEPPTRIVGPNRIIFLENPFADFMGTWEERGGRAMFIEAKSTKDERLPIGNGKLSDDQIDWLIRWHTCGAAVGVIWESAFRVGFLPIGTIEAIRKSGRRHIKFEEADPVPQGMGRCIFDFAQNLRRWYPSKP